MPVIEGTAIRVEVARLLSGAVLKPVWLWRSRIDLGAGEVDLLRQAFLRRCDIEHTFRIITSRRPREVRAAEAGARHQP